MLNLAANKVKHSETFAPVRRAIDNLIIATAPLKKKIVEMKESISPAATFHSKYKSTSMAILSHH